MTLNTVSEEKTPNTCTKSLFTTLYLTVIKNNNWIEVFAISKIIISY